MNIKKIYNTTAIAITALLLTISAGCKKDDKSIKADGTILDFGNPVADGCGWVVRINHIDYSPQNLDDNFKQDSLQVKLTYDKLKSGFYQCGIAANIGLPQIKIKSIRKK